MKKALLKGLAALLSLLLLSASAALAENMMVVNCDEWVSLRQSPDTSSERLMKVPLYETVEDCEWVGNGFVRCAYLGVTGYILDKYLAPVEDNDPGTVLDATLPDGTTIQAFRQYGEIETLQVIAYDDGGNMLWSRHTQVEDPTELTMTDAFIGGTAGEPRVMLFNALEGLYSIDPDTGETLWLLTDEDAGLGASIAHAVDIDGTMYISGYYGPDPVKIDVDGHVIWRSSSGSDDIYWPYDIRIESRGIVTQYEMMYGEREGRVIYDPQDGHVITIEYD